MSLQVRDIYDAGDYLVLITTDRLSAFDRNLASIPFKGQVCFFLHVCALYSSWISFKVLPKNFLRWSVDQTATNNKFVVLNFQVLNETSLWWFNNTQHITSNAIVSSPDRNVVIAKKCSVFPIEFVG